MMDLKNVSLVALDNMCLHTPPAKFLFGVGDNNAKEIADLLFEKMIELKGLGLSANQVGLNIAAFVIGTDELDRMNVFNPEILEEIGEPIIFKEGCLSYPGLFLTVKRPPTIKVKYFNELGEEKIEVLTGLTARVFLHEFDHMRGIVFTKRVSKLKLDMALKKYKKYLKDTVVKISLQSYLQAHNELNNTSRV